MAWLKRFLILALFLFVSFFVVIFCLRNTILVDIDLFFTRFKAVPVESIAIGSFILGGLSGVLFSLSLLYSMRKKYRQALKQAKELQASQS